MANAQECKRKRLKKKTYILTIKYKMIGTYIKEEGRHLYHNKIYQYIDKW